MKWNRIAWLSCCALFAGCSSSGGAASGGHQAEAGTGEPVDAGEVPVAKDGGAQLMMPASTCGNGKRIKGEDCDDGNLRNGDGCSRDCKHEPGFNCPPKGGVCVPTCGDGLIVGNEQCDDGGTANHDGCDQTCHLESGWVCPNPKSSCEATRCGDGIIAGAEQCDDGDDLPGDGCGAHCLLEPGYTCPVVGHDCVASECGDGIRAGSEVCDDGGHTSGDGCSALCDAIEPNYACPPAGGKCIRTSLCGDGVLTSDEECDDHGTANGDGCDMLCHLESGWICPTVGARCVAAMCGDGILAGTEQCETKGSAVTGCTNCQITPGYACTAAIPPTCHVTVCNDGKKEGSEPCDDGNQIIGDGCNPFCEVEPNCSAGACHSSCGDGIKLSSDAEECDDGNTVGGDGCSATCKIEMGYACTDFTTTLPDSLGLPVKFRDFIREGDNGGVKHPDFEVFQGDDATEGMVGSMLSNDKPVYTGLCELNGPNESNKTLCPYTAQTTSQANFDQWYAESSPGVSIPKITKITMNRVTGTPTYQNGTFSQQLFPLDNQGWVALGKEVNGIGQGGASDLHNFAFTSEIHHWFEFKGGEVLTFSGDDDVWVFIDGRLALDLGGLHPRQARTIVLDAATHSAKCFLEDTLTTPCATPSRPLAITAGNVYEMNLFHAERHTSSSNFDLTLTGFVSGRSQCKSQCGDGVVTRDEACDSGSMCKGGTSDGKSCVHAADCPSGSCVSLNDGQYGHCKADCQGYGPQCGDGMIQTQFGEVCDDGFAKNLGAYGGCTSACKLAPVCGDGKVDGFYGEQCDLGAGKNVGGYGGCTDKCLLSPRCGDGVVQSANGEVCDDHVNLSSYGGCGPGCVPAPFCGDGKVQATHEECDLGNKNGPGYGGCTTSCALDPRCGDGVVDKAAGETCDDGNLNDFDGCSKLCKREVLIY